MYASPEHSRHFRVQAATSSAAGTVSSETPRSDCVPTCSDTDMPVNFNWSLHSSFRCCCAPMLTFPLVVYAFASSIFRCSRVAAKKQCKTGALLSGGLWETWAIYGIHASANPDCPCSFRYLGEVSGSGRGCSETTLTVKVVQHGKRYSQPR